MAPEELHRVLWIVYDSLERIIIEADRTIQEMNRSKDIREALEEAFRCTDEVLLQVSDQYIWPQEDLQDEANENNRIY